MEADDWGLTAEDFDFLERDAIQKLSHRNPSFSSTPNPSPPDFNHVEIPCAPEGSILKEHGKVGSAELPKLSVKLFLHSTGTIAAKFNYHPLLVAACKQIPKAAYHDKERVWTFPVLSLSKVEEVLSGLKGANVEVQSLDTFVQRALRAAFTSSDLRGLYNKMPNYIESKLLPFQRDGVRFVLQHGGRALIADEMGLGKTLQAIAVASCLREHWPVLVLAPSSLRLQWASMIQEWLDIPPSDILVVLPPCGGPSKSGFNLVYSSSKNIIQLDGAFNIISYDAVQKLQDLLLASEFKIVIADESHFLKNSHAKRTTSSAPILQRARYTLLLSGTPALSRPIELFKQLEALYPDVYKNFHEYGMRYCRGGVFGMYQGASNHEELHNLMKSTLMIRRLKKDVLAELPMKRRQQVFLDLQGKGVKELKVLTRELDVIKAKMKTCGSADEAESLRLSRQSMVSRIFNESSEVKLPAVIDFLDSTVMEAPFKFLVFAHHQCMIDGIHQHLIKKKVGCIRIDGGTPSSSRQALVTEFQEKEDIRAAVLSIKAGGVGLTLTAASTVIFAELSWNPGDITQAEDRAHRIGQASSVNIYYLLANDTVDDMMWNTIHNKSGNLGQMLDGHENTLEVSYSDPGSDCSKQKTLDTFLRRCPGEEAAGQLSKFKRPRKQN